jgi:hypothetical protein
VRQVNRDSRSYRGMPSMPMTTLDGLCDINHQKLKIEHRNR